MCLSRIHLYISISRSICGVYAQAKDAELTEQTNASARVAADIAEQHAQANRDASAQLQVKYHAVSASANLYRLCKARAQKKPVALKARPAAHCMQYKSICYAWGNKISVVDTSAAFGSAVVLQSTTKIAWASWTLSPNNCMT